MLQRLLIKLCTAGIFPFAWTVFAIVMLCLPASDIPSGGPFSLPNLDKLVHMTLFGGVAFFWGIFGANLRHTRQQKTSWLIGAAVFSILLGTIMEFIQLRYIPSRDYDPWDIVADSAGALLLMLWLTRWVRSGKL